MEGDFTMSLEKNKSIVRGFIDAYNERDLARLDEYVAPDYVDHTNQLRGRESLKQVIYMGFKAFPDWHETIEDIIAEGEMVWVRLSYTGTNTGDWRGMAPTGKRITMTAVDIYRIVDGRLAEYWNVTDALSFFRQLGAIEYTESGRILFPEGTK
ncbi:MAG: ester cyclase [Methanomassiliicoccales archaeon]